MSKDDIEALYDVTIRKARRGYYYSRKLKDGMFLSKDYPTLEIIEQVLANKRKANLVFTTKIS